MSFESLGVRPDLCRMLEKAGIAAPFPIQAATLPDALAGRDVCGRAPTGSGKTLAFGIALAQRLEGDRGRSSKRPRGLVLVPTRELASQVRLELAQLVSSDVGVVAVYGGTPLGPQRRAIAAGASIVVACPGRLEDLIERGDVELSAVEVVVVDEADRMADMGFLPAVRRVLDATRSDRQTLLFSATLDGEVDALVRRYQVNPARHEVRGDDRDGTRVRHEFIDVARDQRIRRTAELVGEHGPTIVFSRTRHGADRLARRLERDGVRCAVIHGNRSQGQRERALEAFRSGKAHALIATDVAARGIHVDDVACVVHFDLPDDVKDYVHRSGRTGRAGADGVVIALVTPEQRSLAASIKRTVGAATAGPKPTNAPKPAAAPKSAAAPKPAVVSKPAKEPRRSRNGERSGTVKFFHRGRGYGFIVDEAGADVFVHVSNITRAPAAQLETGQRVSYELREGRKGHEAHKVEVV